MTPGGAPPTLTPMAPPHQPPRTPAPERAERPAKPAADEAMLVCPNCGARLTERKCKLLCPSPLCGYYLSCSDYY